MTDPTRAPSLLLRSGAGAPAPIGDRLTADEPGGLVATVYVATTDVALRIALGAVAAPAGLRMVDGPDDADIAVTDRLPDDIGPVPVVVAVPPSAFACQAAIAAAVDGRVTAVICADDPDRLPTAVAAVLAGWCVFDQRIIDASVAAPRINDRQAALLHLLLRGLTNEALAAQRSTSISTIKRDLHELFEAFGASNRRELVANAQALGWAVD